MSRFPPFALGIALPISLFSSAAFADLTPTQVWGDWRSYMESMGYEVDATETTTGSTLSVENIDINFALPENEGAVSLSLGKIDFTQNSDGTVAIILPDTMPITMSGTDGLPDGAPFNMVLDYSQTGHALTASGTPEQMSYLYTAETFGMNLAQMQVGDDMLPPQDAKLSISGNNLRSATDMIIRDNRSYSQTGSVQNISYDIFIRNTDESDAEGAIEGSIIDLAFSGAGVIPLEMDAGADMATMLDAGFDISGQASYAAGASNIDMKDSENGNFVMTTTSKGGDFGVKVGANGIAYDVTQRDLAINVVTEAMPFPVEIEMAETGFNLAMPVRKSDDPQDFAFGLKISEFTISDVIWNLFDPSAQLPRDPASFLLDLSGKVKLLVDFLDPEAVDDMAQTPGEVQQLTLGNLLISAAGAKLDGSGEVSFDGAETGLVPGVGNPVGEVNLALAGANGLIDRLVAMGLLPQDQAMGARMMMGLFAVAGDAPDTLKSRVEFTSDGQILANGQRLR